MISISWIPIGKKNLLGVSQFPGKNLQNIFDLSSFLKDLQIIKKQKVKIIVSLLPENEKPSELNKVPPVTADLKKSSAFAAFFKNLFENEEIINLIVSLKLKYILPDKIFAR